MVHNDSDSRTVERSKAQLRKALTELLSKKSFDKIKVTELTDEAGLSRATFYLHYENMEDFFKETEDYLYGKFADQALKLLEDGEEMARFNCRERNLLFDRDERELLNVLTGGDVSIRRANAILRTAYEKVFNFVKEKHYGTDAEFCKNEIRVKCFSMGYIHCILENLTNYDPDKMYRDYCRCQFVGKILDKNKLS